MKREINIPKVVTIYIYYYIKLYIIIVSNQYTGVNGTKQIAL